MCALEMSQDETMFISGDSAISESKIYTWSTGTWRDIAHFGDGKLLSH
jgi:hypothetical protein